MQPRTKFSGCSTCRILSHLCICNIFVRSHPLCPKWAAVPWHTGAKSKQSQKCPAGLLSLAMQQPLPSLPVSCSRTFPLTTTWTEICHPSANSSPTPARLCRPVASQPGRGSLTPSLPKTHLEIGQYKNSLCLEAAH